MSWEDHAVEVLGYDVQREERALWLATRRQGLGGSDARVLMGHGYADESPVTVLRSKLLDLPEGEDNIRWRRGLHMESFIAEEFARTQLAGTVWAPELTPLERAGTWRNRDRPWQLVNPDWRVGQLGMESKHVDNYANARAYQAMDGPPPRFYWQCLHCMDAVGADGWFLAIDSPHYSQLLVHYLDAEECMPDMLLMRERLGNWWVSHVVHGFELTEREAAVEPTAAPDPDRVAEAVLPDLVLELLARWRELKYPNTKKGKEEVKRILEMLKTQIGTANVLTVDGVPVLRWQQRRNPGQPDWAAIEKATGKAKEHFMTTGAASWHLAEVAPTGEGVSE